MMNVAGLAVDPTRGDPVVLLRDVDNRHQLPIWIGEPEAMAIASELQGVRHPRPLTHDLLRNTIEAMGWDVTRIEITDLRNNTFYARIFVRQGEDEISVDSRPSDALALAIRTGAKIYAHDHVVQQARMDPPDPADEEEGEEGEARAGANGGDVPVVRANALQKPVPESDEEWEAYLERLQPADFGDVKH